VNPPGLVVAGAAVIVTSDWLKTTQQAVLIAGRTRRVNGLPASAADAALVEALAQAMAAYGQSDVPEPPGLQHYPQTEPTVTVKDAGRQLKLSERQTVTSRGG
jgi:hypothetical protein